MARRHASRLAFAVLAAAAAVAVGVYAFKSSGGAAGTDKLLAHQDGPALPVTASVVPQIEQHPADAKLIRDDTTSGASPTTQPRKPGDAGQPVTGDVESLFRQASAKRQAGDLVTARNLISDALADGRMTGSNVDEAKSFVGSLNEKIILGTQKFSADPYNKEWKVEPGTVLVKLAKRFDVTAELLCKVNGLSSPNRLKAGVTIKAIQGPFHLVVSKSKFEADVYLGAPGGPGSMYVKTFHVGLGSDGSTPTGTWIVETGKVTNPVYYSPRGEGVIAADDPKNPLGERWIPLKGIDGECVGKESYGVHGTIEPDSIGKNMSLGCIRLLNDDVVQIYDLLVEGKSMVKVVRGTRDAGRGKREAPGERASARGFHPKRLTSTDPNPATRQHAGP